jgi:hypothetical protein
MHFFEDTRDRTEESVLHGGLSRLLTSVSRSLFGGGAVIDAHRPQNAVHETNRGCATDDDMGWLSLTSDADGHSVYEEDVICMGVTPDDLDVHDADGGDLSWIGLSPVHPAGHNGSH